MNCKDCDHCKRHSGVSAFVCKHPDVEESALNYEKLRGKRITKSKNFVGWNLPKTCLRWCPLKK